MTRRQVPVPWLFCLLLVACPVRDGGDDDDNTGDDDDTAGGSDDDDSTGGDDDDATDDDDAAGGLAPWASTLPLPEPREGARAVVSGGFMYVVAGNRSATQRTATIFIGTLSADEGVTEWRTSDVALARARVNPCAWVWNERLYVGGGWDGEYLSDVSSGRTNADGSLGAFRPEADLRTARENAACAVRRSVLYIAGGRSGDARIASTEWASVGPSGILDDWEEGADLPTVRTAATMVAFDDSIYLLGGDDDTAGRADVLRSDILEDDAPGPWNPVEPLASALGNTRLVSAQGALWTVGGDLATTTWRAVPADDGSLSSWEVEPELLPLGLRSHDVAARASNLYSVGGRDAGQNPQAVVYWTTVDP